MQNLFDMAQAVSLRTASKSAIQAFIALDFGAGSDRGQALAAAFALTPRVMEWGDGFWLLDISVCLNYWSTRAAHYRTDPLHLLATQLEAIAKESNIKAWSGAMAPHPWQSLLLSRHMRKRGIRGFLSIESPFGQTLYRELAWSCWRHSVETLAAHRWALGIKPSDPASTRRQLDQLERSVKRMGIRTPWSLRDIPGEQLRRRFGSLVHDVRDWAYGPHETINLYDNGFPWQAVVVEDKPQVTTHLDQPLCEWEHIQPLLRKDLDRLCELATWQARERVVSLEWRLVFSDLSNLSVSIRFRHPHPLHLEKGVHATALLQALYAFQSSVPRQSIADSAGNMLETDAFVVPIVSWTLVVNERLRMPTQASILFDDGLDRDTQTLLHIENRLKIELSSYHLRSDWLPEDSYGVTGSLDAEIAAVESLPSLKALAKTRPLFVYNHPQSLFPVDKSARWEFCERTAGKWWDAIHMSEMAGQDLIPQRDYYRLTDREKRSYWVYRNTQSQCFIHGVYV